jgi:hypothetical protein
MAVVELNPEHAAAQRLGDLPFELHLLVAHSRSVR